jgi:hypothetical protein
MNRGYTGVPNAADTIHLIRFINTLAAPRFPLFALYPFHFTPFLGLIYDKS